MKDFFKDLTVVEFASVLAGPSVGMFFAELGARVIKIENQNTGGDVTRSWKLASEDPNHPFSAYYSSVNAFKETTFLNLRKPEDLIKAKQITQSADVLISNFKSVDAQKLQLDFNSLKKNNTQLIYGEISGFSDKNRLAYDIVLQAESGFLSMNGTPEGELCKMPVALIDLLAAHQLKEGILLAMLAQQNEKKPLKVSVSLYNAALSSLVNQATNYLMADQIAQPMGTLHPNIAPYGELFATADDKKIILAVASNTQFVQLCKALQLDSLAKDDRFSDNQKRVINRNALQSLLQIEIKKIDRKKLLQLFLEKGVPAGAVRNMQEVLLQKEAQENILEEVKENNTLKTLSGNAFSIST